MSIKRLFSIAVILATSLLTATTLAHSTTADADVNNQLWYTVPASIWEETLPVGNGRMGMMPSGEVNRESIVLNEISLWSGSEVDYRNPEAAKSLPAIRQLLFQGRNEEAQQLMYSSFLPSNVSEGRAYGSFQTLGTLDINFTHPNNTTTNYRRGLMLNEAVAYTEYECEGVKFRREYFVSRHHDLMLVHLTATQKGAISFSATLSRPAKAEFSTLGNAQIMQGTLDSGVKGVDGMKYMAAMKLIASGGSQTVSENGISLTGANEAWIVVSAATSFEAQGTNFPGANYKEFCLNLINQKGDFKKKHIKEHAALYNRVSITLPSSPDDALPTNERLIRFQDNDSPGLAQLYYNYGRYLLICSTRPGSLPPNLQGLWANGLTTPWNGDYHTNINVQMNHWPLEQGGLDELYQPLISFVSRLVPSGELTAKAFYGENAKGWVQHMMSNIWNFTAPGEHPSWGATNTGGAWLCAHLWERYDFTRNVQYLKEIYPILRGAAMFFHSTTVKEPNNGWIVTAPTSSPENNFYVGDSNTPIAICMGPTMDIQLLTQLYTNVISASQILGVDKELAAQLQEDMSHFPPMQISKEGYLQEWLQDYREQDIHHRHVSHLYGLHPSNQISPATTPALAEACRNTLNRRGDGGTGWSRAWKINFWARLGDGDRAWKLFRSLLAPAVDPKTKQHGSGTFPNLFCSHPPFQIDGNFGGTAGIGEMLLQSHNGHIELIPALPSNWSDGEMKGMRVRGNAKVDMQWTDGKVKWAKFTALSNTNLKIKHPTTGEFITLTLKKGKSKTLTF